MESKQMEIVDSLRGKSYRDISEAFGSIPVCNEMILSNVNSFINVREKNNLLKKVVDQLNDDELNKLKIQLNKANEGGDISMNKDVFIVHGRDTNARNEVELFLLRQGINARILENEPDEGQTIIEKFENCALDVGYAIILSTPCDIGGKKGQDPSSFKSRVRQNVLFEHGFFVAKLGRKNVCVLQKEDVEKIEFEQPSDTDGLIYILMDDNGAWKAKLFKNMNSTGQYKLNKDI